MVNNYTRINKTIEEAQKQATRNNLIVERVPAHKKAKGSAEPLYTEGVDEQWKHDVWFYMDALPEVNNVIATSANMISSCALNVGKQDSSGGMTPLDDPELNVILRDLDGPAGDYKQIMHAMATHLQTSGDGWLVAKPKYSSRDAARRKITGYTNWEYLGVDEIKVSMVEVKNGEITRSVRRLVAGGSRNVISYDLGEAINAEQDTNMFLARLYRRSPQYSGLSTSSMKSVLGLCKLLVKLTDLINAIASSQLPAGLLLVPEELSFGPVEETTTDDRITEDDVDTLTEALMLSLGEPMEDPTSPYSLVPSVVRGKSDYLEKIKFLPLSRELDKQQAQIRKELLHRIAMGMDAPAEAMEGKSGLSHWSSFNNDIEFTVRHIEPLGRLIASELTRNYLWPILRKRIADGKSQKELEDVERYRFIFDSIAITGRVDKPTMALKLHERELLSDEATVKWCGFSITDMKSSDESRQSLILELIRLSPVTLAPLLVRLLDGLEHIEILVPENPSIPSGDIVDPKNANEKDMERPKGSMPDPANQDKNKLPGNADEDRRNPTSSRLSTSNSEMLSAAVFDLAKELNSVETTSETFRDTHLNAVGKFFYSLSGLLDFDEDLIEPLTNRVLTLSASTKFLVGDDKEIPVELVESIVNETLVDA